MSKSKSIKTKFNLRNITTRTLIQVNIAIRKLPHMGKETRSKQESTKIICKILLN